MKLCYIFTKTSIFEKIFSQNERRTNMFAGMLLIFAKVFAKNENNQMIFAKMEMFSRFLRFLRFANELE